MHLALICGSSDHHLLCFTGTLAAEIIKQTPLCTILAAWICNSIFRSPSTIHSDILLVSTAELNLIVFGSCDYLNFIYVMVMVPQPL